MQDQTYLRPAEAAKFIGAGLSTLWRYANQPGFPARVKISTRLTVFRRDELAAWVESHRTGGSAA
ncbi:MAG: helix-turn-helix domain-containing protein [Azoarcus sp. PHD]|nr:MAG: helix-turn-helix domain-containing protein [Azoarcus sp. PHD]